MNKTVLDLWVGIFVIAGVGALLFLALKVGSMNAVKASEGYEVVAAFDNIGGLKARAPVKSAGVVVGRVSDISFDSQAYEALVTLRIDKRYAFPKDTFANINRAFNLTPMIQVDDLYVSPESRNAKIGFNLIYQLAFLAKNKNIGRLNVWCMKDNQQGQNFYQKIGAEKRDFIDVYSIEVMNLLAC